MIMLMPKPALYTAALIFAVIALLHLIRYFLDTEIVVGGAVVPVFASLPAGIILALLALWMVRTVRRSQSTAWPRESTEDEPRPNRPEPDDRD